MAKHPASRGFGPASEACPSGAALVANLQRRLQLLQSHPGAHPELEGFLDDSFNPALTSLVQWARNRYGQAGLSFEQNLADEEWTLSPSDFGFHNALRRPGGRMVFLDFEYFGWDDPAKTVSDFLLHPAMNLTTQQKKAFAAGFARIAWRVQTLYPLYGLKWCLILLNEFLPEHLHRRKFAAFENFDRDAVLSAQLNKAREMLSRIHREFAAFPYLD